IELSAFRETVACVTERLRTLYRAAGRHLYRHADGRLTPKFINLDMEEYRDLDLTVTAFREVLDEPEFLPLSAGIVLQAYLPDSHRVQCALTEWALARRARGGAPITLRIVKSAHPAREPIEAAGHAWAGGLLRYAPVVRAEDFHSAIAYLVRRLDENTAPENFLRHVFNLEPGSPAFLVERDRFLAAFGIEARLSDAPRRFQDRRAE